MTREKEVITLGRGTSDLTAVELAILLKQDMVTLYKEVNGIYPSMHVNLLRIRPHEYLSYDEIISLINIGFEPINYKAIIEAKKTSLKIKVTNFIENNEETIISNQSSKLKVIGFNIENNRILVATLFVDEIKEELFSLLRKQHIYVKEDEEGNDYFSFKINASQTLLVRQIILKKYFYMMFRH